MKKLTRGQAEAFWEAVHQDAGDDLSAVCFPDKSRFFNHFFDMVQRLAVGRALDATAKNVAGSTVLDVGCGRGRWLAFFTSRGALASGLDISESAVEHCRANGYEAQVATIAHIPANSSSQDLVTSITVMLHLNPELQKAAAAEMQRVCRPGGHILLLEGTRPDHSAHVWSRPLDRWLALFDECDPILVEGHHFTPLLRALWGSPAAVVPRPLLRPLEDVVVAWSIPIELLIMRAFLRRPTELGLQHVMLLRKRGRHV